MVVHDSCKVDGESSNLLAGSIFTKDSIDITSPFGYGASDGYEPLCNRRITTKRTKCLRANFDQIMSRYTIFFLYK